SVGRLQHGEGTTITFNGGTMTITTAQSLTQPNIDFLAAVGGQVGTLTINSVVAGTGGIKVVRNGIANNTVVLGNSANTITGDIVVRNDNNLKWGANNVIPDANTLIFEVAGGNFAATFDLAGFSDTVKTLLQRGDAASGTRGPATRIVLGSGT